MFTVENHSLYSFTHSYQITEIISFPYSSREPGFMAGKITFPLSKHNLAIYTASIFKVYYIRSFNVNCLKSFLEVDNA